MKAKTTPKTRRDKSNTQKTEATGIPGKRKQALKKDQPAQQQIETILERVGDGFVAFDADMNYTYVNKRGGELLGRKPKDLIGKNYWAEYPEAKGSVFANAYVETLETQKTIVLEDYYAPFDRWFENRIYPSKDGLSIFFSDITERKRAEFLLADEKNVLAMIAQGEPLLRILEEITLKIEAQTRGMLCTILLLDRDGIRVRHGAAPSMEETFIKAIDDQPIGPSAGSCGTSAYRKEPVFVSDIATDPLWLDYREVALKHGLRACWSTPILSNDGMVLGTFAMYYREPRSPKPSDIRLIGIATRLTKIALERDQSARARQDAQERLALAVYSANVGLWDWDLSTNKVYYSPEWKSQLGFENHEISNDFWEWESRVHPDDLERAKATVNSYLQNPYPSYQNEFRMRHKDDSYRWILAQASLLKDEQGRAVRMIGSHIDITERKQIEEDLRKSAQTFSVIFNKAPFAAGLASFSDGMYIEVNDEFERVFGFQREEIIGRTSLDLGMYPDPEIRARSAELFRKQGFVYNLDVKLRTRNGEARDVLINTDLVDIGGEKYILTTANDITERKRAEENLRQSEELFSNAFHVSPAGIIITRIADGKIKDANEAFLDMFEFSREETIGHTSIELKMLSPEERARLIQKQLEAGGLRNFELLARSKSGRLINLLFSSKPMEIGGEACHITTLIDITERKQAEDEIRRLKEFDENLINNMAEGIVVQNTEGYFTFVNPAASIITGYLSEELLGKHWTKFIPPDQHDIVKKADKRRPAGEVSEYELDFLHKSGRQINLLVSGSPFFEKERFNGTMAVFTDITEHKQAGEKIRMQLEQLTALREIDQSITSTLDLHASLRTLVLHAARLLNVDAITVLLLNSENELLEYGEGLGFWTDAPKTASVKLGESYAGRAVMERRPVAIPNLADDPDNLLLTGFLKDEKFVSYYGAPLIAKEKPIGALEVFQRSVVERDGEWFNFFTALAGQAAIAIDNARLFEDLQRTNIDLETRVVERTADLIRANRAKDEFLATMSHELRTPLNAVLNMSESLEEGVYGEITPRQIGVLRIIAESGRHLLELINDILDLSKIEAGKLELRAEPVPVEILCQASLRMIKETALLKGVQVSMSNASNIEVILADGRRLKQMLVNLLSNAVKFTSPGGQVGLEVSREGDHTIRFSVWDTGIGIPADQLEKIFKPFVQLDSSLSRQYTGTGLGLALVRELAELHGGSVGVESEVGKGSRFYFILPIQSLNAPIVESETPSAELKPMETAIQHTGEKKRILLVEDNVTNMLVTSDYLNDKGYQIIAAANGLEAVERALENQPDLILMDIQMPGISGLEAIQRLRAAPGFDSVPIIALTALAMPGDKERCLEAGANEYLAKPVSLKALTQMIESLL